MKEDEMKKGKKFEREIQRVCRREKVWEEEEEGKQFFVLKFVDFVVSQLICFNFEYVN